MGESDDALKTYEQVFKVHSPLAPAIFAGADMLLARGHSEPARQFMVSH